MNKIIISIKVLMLSISFLSTNLIAKVVPGSEKFSYIELKPDFAYLKKSEKKYAFLYQCAQYAASKNKKYFMLYDSLYSLAINRPAVNPNEKARFTRKHAFIVLTDQINPFVYNSKNLLEQYKRFEMVRW